MPPFPVQTPGSGRAGGGAGPTGAGAAWSGARGRWGLGLRGRQGGRLFLQSPPPQSQTAAVTALPWRWVISMTASEAAQAGLKASHHPRPCPTSSWGARLLQAAHRAPGWPACSAPVGPGRPPLRTPTPSPGRLSPFQALQQQRPPMPRCVSRMLGPSATREGGAACDTGSAARLRALGWRPPGSAGSAWSWLLPAPARAYAAQGSPALLGCLPLVCGTGVSALAGALCGGAQGVSSLDPGKSGGPWCHQSSQSHPGALRLRLLALGLGRGRRRPPAGSAVQAGGARLGRRPPTSSGKGALLPWEVLVLAPGR